MYRVVRRIGPILLVTLGLLACERGGTLERAADDAPSSPTAPGFLVEDSFDASITTTGSEQFLAELWSLSEMVQYDSIEGTIDCASGGSFTGVPASWQPAYADRIFGLSFPPGAWDSTVYGNSIRFRIRVPRLDSVMPCCNAPMFFELEAEGFAAIQFTQPVQVTFSDHPILNSWCDSDILFNYGSDPLTGLLYLGDVFTITATPFTGERDPSCGIARTAEVMHFSKWGRKNGQSGSEGGGGPVGTGDLNLGGGLCPDLTGDTTVDP